MRVRRLPSATFRTVVAVLALLLIPRWSMAAPGDLDSSFGVGGVVHTEFAGTYPETAAAIVMQPDGKLVAVGQEASGWAGVGVARYLPDGTLDGAFGNGGLVATGYPDPLFQIGTAAALQADGKLVVLAYAFGLLRLDSDGSLDDSFADHGTLRLEVDGVSHTSIAVAVQADGKILVLGDTTPPYPEKPEFVLVRLDTSGDTDLVLHGTTEGRALAIQTDGKIVVGGERITRYHPDGTLDDSFGTGGEVADANIHALALAPDGRMLGLCSGTCITRFTAGGALDMSFGIGGRTTLDLAQLPIDVSYVYLDALAVQPDGRAIAVGRGNGAFVVRFDRSGVLDPSFGRGGVIDLTPASSGFPDVLLQPDAKIVGVGGYGEFFVARLLGDVCGDGVQQAGEACDDGNLVDGDGCDSNCRPTGCGNGIVTAGEECDDGNVASGDCCSPSCAFEAPGSACDDGNACTSGDTCEAGVCVAGTARNCDDGDACTHDDCDPFAGLCGHEPSTDVACPPALPALDWLHRAWSQFSAVGDEEPHFGSQTVLAGDQLFVLARGEFYGANVQVLDAASGDLKHIVTNRTPTNDFSELGPIAALGNDLVVVSTPPPATVEDPSGPATVDIYDGATFALRRQLVDPTPETPWSWWDYTNVLTIAGRVLVADWNDHAIYIFDPASGDLLHTLLPPPPEDAAAFGGAIVPLGSGVLVRGSDAVYLFDVASGALLQTFDDPTPGLGKFGDSIAAFGANVLIGGRREDAVYLFNAATGALLRTFADPDRVDQLFGAGIAVVGSNVVVGRGTGRVHVFDGSTGALRYTILDPAPSTRGCFGLLLPVLDGRLAISDTCASSGPYTPDDQVGVVYLFELETGTLIGVIPDQYPYANYRDAIHAVLSYGHTILVQTYNDGDGGLLAYTSCLDGVVADGEECDDGNFVSGDGCDNNCTVSRCGNGFVAAGEECDDGNQIDDDACSNECKRNVCGDGVIRQSYEQCDDGPANGTAGSCCTASCTLRSDGESCSVPAVCGSTGVCSAGSCLATAEPCWPCGSCDPERGCIPAPAPDCHESLAPEQSTLMVERHANPKRDRLAWRWRKGASTSAAAFGQPETRDAYGLCVYDESETQSRLLMSADLPPLARCRNDESCWRTVAHGALHRYRDPKGGADGLTSVDLTPGADGHAQVVVTGRGERLQLAPLPWASPLRVQLRASNGECWETSYSANGFARDDDTRLRATGDRGHGR